MAILEESLTIAKQVKGKIIQKAREQHEWYLSHKKTADEDIQYYKTIRDNEKQPNVKRVLASHIIETQLQTMLITANETITLSLLGILSSALELALTTTNKELSELKQTATSTSRNEYDEKIKHLETNLKQLQQETDSMKPYYDAIRNAMEKMTKWRDTNK